MDFIINENQLKAILREQDESKMTNYMKRLYSFSKEMNWATRDYGTIGETVAKA